jgi:hypothetical protein
LENKELHEANLNKQFIEEMELKRKKEREEWVSKMPKKDYKPIDDIEYQLQLFLTLNPKRINDTAFNCFNMIKNIISNIFKNPNEPKYQKIKFTSQGFQNKIGNYPGPMKIFDILGFDYEDEYMIYKGNDDKDLLKNAVEVVEKFVALA